MGNKKRNRSAAAMNESTEETTTEETTEAPAETAQADGAAPRARRLKRVRPMWVLIPDATKAVPILDEEGNETGDFREEIKNYRVVKCAGKPGVRKVLAEYNIDPTNFESVLVFRADPMAFVISQQLVIRI